MIKVVSISIYFDLYYDSIKAYGRAEVIVSLNTFHLDVINDANFIVIRLNHVSDASAIKKFHEKYWQALVCINGSSYSYGVSLNTRLITTVMIIEKPGAGTSNSLVNQKSENSLKRIRNSVPRELYNHIKGIRDIIPNRTQNQCQRGLTVQT